MRQLLILCVMLITMLPHAGRAQADQRCFPETGHCISGRFRQYWEQHGGVPVFGFPISSASAEIDRDTGQSYLTQWFERSRFELHPENTAPYDVMLGRLGDARLRQLGHNWTAFINQAPSDPHYFGETGHAIEFEPFWTYWSTHGQEFDGRPGTSLAESIALFGFPISRAISTININGDLVLAQWFERARLEYHPNNPAPFQVMLGLLGTAVRQNQTGSASEATDPANSAPQPVSSMVELVRHGFGQNGQRVGYGFVLRNNQDRVAERVEYTVKLLDKSGAVVGIDAHFLRIMYPNETVGVANDIVVNAGIQVTGVQVQIAGGRVGSGVFADLDFNPLSAANVTYRSDPVYPRIAGTIRNRLPAGIDDVRVNGLAYNSAGAIIGGGFTFANLVPAGGEAQVEALITAAGIPARVELYPIATVESDLGDADEDEK